MSKLFLGFDPTYGPVARLMANAAHNPLTHPASDYGAFRRLRPAARASWRITCDLPAPSR